jgi:hypothetical protein
LDTGTTFLGRSVGYACGFDEPYMSFSGDDTTAGGSERINIDVTAARSVWYILDAILDVGFLITSKFTPTSQP